MAQLLALEWDGTEARVAVAASRGDRVVIEQAFSVALGASESDATDAAAEKIGIAIRRALDERGIGRMPCLVGVGRSSIELKNLVLPPAPADELPDMVRLQSVREFNNLAEDWPLDFIPVPSDPQQPSDVLVAAISPELVGEIRETCQAAGLEPRRLILRPCAAASLLGRRQPMTGKTPRLLVDLLADEVDLTVLLGDTVLFLRTARLPGAASSPDDVRPLVSEIRRTIAAVQNRWTGQRVESVTLCGDERQQTVLAAQIRQELNLPVAAFDPFAQCELTEKLSTRLPPFRSRFAPLLGMLFDEFSGDRPAIDFLNPRRRPPAPSRRNQYIRAGAAAAGILVAVVGGTWWRLASLESEIAQRTEESKALDPELAQMAQVEKSVAEIDRWAISDIVWLDELSNLAKQLPPPQDAILNSLRVGANAVGGEIRLEGLVRAPALIDQLGRKLRDDHHRVESQQGAQSDKAARYGWRFKSSVVIERDPGKAPRKARK